MKQFISSRLFRFIASAGIAVLLFFMCPPCFNRYLLALVLFLVLVFVNLDQFFARFSWLTTGARIIVGCLFIFSGFIKANDPVGFGYKMEEYFTVFGEGFSCDMKLPNVKADGIPCEKEQAAAEAPKAAPKASFMKPVWDFFKEYSLAIAIFICAVEMVLGVFLLMGFRARLTLWLLLAMIVFFSFLTFYSACCDKVKSCGCFGDFLPLTPWQSFWKDLILLVLVTLLFTGVDNIRPVFQRNGFMWISIAVLTFISFWIPYHTWKHLPFFDFRPFAIGTNLYKESHEKDPAKKECLPDTTLFTYYYKKGNQYKQFGQYLIAGSYTKSIDTTSPPDTTWEFFCSDRKVLHAGNCAATILNFVISDLSTQTEITDSLLQIKGGQFFFVMYDADKTDRSVMASVNEFYSDCQKNKIPFNGLSHSDSTQLGNFRKATKAAFPVYFCDEVPLKTFIRSNPGLVYVENSVVKAMWHFNDFPKFSDFKNEYPGTK